MAKEYIEKEAVKALFKKWADGYSYVEVPAEYAIKAIESLPAASVRENVEARWIDMGDHLLCSSCGATHYGADKNFCPNCGADMTGGNDVL